jgi:hypothetical protein
MVGSPWNGRETARATSEVPLKSLTASVLALTAASCAAGRPNQQTTHRLLSGPEEQADAAGLEDAGLNFQRTTDQRLGAGLDDASIAGYRRLVNEECSARGATFPSWAETQPPTIGDLCPRFDLCDWRVGVEGNGMVVTARQVGASDERLSNEIPPFSEPPPGTGDFIGDRRWTRLPNGWLAAFDAGEFGAGVWWFSPDGTTRERLGDQHVTALLDVGSEKWLATGLAHSARGGGTILRADYSGNHWSFGQVATLEQGACAATADSAQSALVVTRSRLFRVSRSGLVTKLHDGAWAGLYPSSVLIGPGGRLFIGARHAVIRLDPNGSGYAETWLVSPSCTASFPKTCKCSP